MQSITSILDNWFQFYDLNYFLLKGFQYTSHQVLGNLNNSLCEPQIKFHIAFNCSYGEWCRVYTLYTLYTWKVSNSLHILLYSII